MLSDDQVHAGLADLCATFGRPFGTDGAGDRTLVQAWRRALNEVEPDEFRIAVVRLMRDSAKFPVPKQIRELAFQLRFKRRVEAKATENHATDGPIPFCPRCNSFTMIEDLWHRMRPRHAENCPGLHPDDLEIQRLSLARRSLLRPVE